MKRKTANDSAYDRPISIAEGVYWIGFYEEQTSLHCNPYLIIEGEDAVVIDSGSRAHFPIVMMKILMAGINPKNIKALVYQHYDPDLCGSMSNMVDICENEDLLILSHSFNALFLNSYLEKQHQHFIYNMDGKGYRFSLNGRELEFYHTPYCHTPGSFVTYDKKTGTLFTSDLFGSFSEEWDLFLDFKNSCFNCTDIDRPCPERYCPLDDIARFHKQLMPSGKAVRHALSGIKEIDARILAPQHGSVIRGQKAIDLVISMLESLEGIGADGLLKQ
jgi:flavorubredoxin